MIFGLGFATFLTLIMVPVMYLISDKIKVRVGLHKKPITGNGLGRAEELKQAVINS